MISRAEIVTNYEHRMVDELGQWAEDPRARATVGAKVSRAAETLAHMDKPLPHEVKPVEMEPNIAYSLT